jgi:hypothetical protein
MRRDLSVNRHSKDRLDSRVAIPVEALSEADLDRLDQSKIPEETKKLDDLVPENGAGKTMEVGYLSRDSRYAHLLSELITCRY